MSNLFDKAKSAPSKSPKSKLEAPPVKTAGLEVYAQIDALEKQLESLKKTVARPEVVAVMVERFIENKGANYDGTEGDATGKLMLNKRSSASGLKDNELELLTQHNIPVERIEGDFKLNVAGLSAKKLNEVSDAIRAIKGLPDDFITFDDSKARTVTTEKSLEAVFKINDKDAIRQLIPVVGTIMIKPKYSGEVGPIFKAISKMLGV